MSKARQLADLGNVYDDGALSNRNIVTNGSFLVWQRGTSQTISGYGSVDRWQVVNITSASRQTDAPSGFQYSIHIENSSASFPFIAQKWEAANVQHLSGADITLSFWAKSVSGTASLFAEILTPNTVDDYNAVTARENTAWATPSTAWTKYTYTFTNVNAAVLNGLEIRIGLQNQSAGSIRITGVMLEIGDTATPFEHRSYADQLQACQRYYQKSYPQAVTPSDSYVGGVEGPLAAYATSYAYGSVINYPVIMRTYPTITFYANAGTSGTAGKWAYYNGTWNVADSIGAAVVTDSFFTPSVTKSSGYTAQNVYLFSGNYTLDAEL